MRSFLMNVHDADCTESIQGKSGKTIGKRFSLSEFGKKLRMKNQGRVQNPIVPGAADYIQGFLYDRITAAASSTLASQLQWFTVPYNQQSKTKADTNLSLSQTLPAPQWINVVFVGMYFADTMQKVDIDGFINSYWMEFWVQDKIYLDGPAWCFPSAGGLTGMQTFAAAATSTAYINGTANQVGFDVRLPAGIDLGGVATDGQTGIMINGGQNFHFDAKSGGTLTLAAASGSYGGFLTTVTLQGIISRQVQ